MAERLITLRYAARCAACAAELRPRTKAWWDDEAKSARCEHCSDEPAPPAKGSAAGASAQRIADRRTAKREARIRARHPRIGGLILALSDEPQSTRAWSRGAEGERRVGGFLDAIDSPGVVTLHDRRIPRSKANIDHIVVSPNGVWVVDTKRYTGQVEKRDVGGWFSTDLRLYVGRRDCTKLVGGMAKQVTAVRDALGDVWSATPIRAALCFVDAEWSFFARPFELDGVVVLWPRALRDRIKEVGSLTVGEVESIASQLEALLPACH